MKKLLRKGGLVERGGRGSKLFIVLSVFLQKSMFSLLLECFFFFFCLVNIHVTVINRSILLCSLLSTRK